MLDLLLLPDAHTVLLPESDNCHTYMPTINRPTGRQALYLTTITTAAGTVLLLEQAFAAYNL